MLRAVAIATVLSSVSLATGCAGTAGPVAGAPSDAAPVTFEGTVASIDTQPWTYDGNAVVLVETDARGRVAVQLPARWNLCRAPAVDVQALSVGSRVQVAGEAGGEGEVVVCADESHRLAPMD